MAAAPTARDHAAQGLFTPVKSAHSHSRLQDSPFSDYFTDDGRSPDAHDAPSPEKRQLLLRLNSLQSQLFHSERDSERQTMNIVEKKVHEIESQLNALHSQTRMPPEMEDSGLFMEEDEEEEDEAEDDRQYNNGASNGSIVALHPRHPVTPEQKQAESDFLLLESQRVLESVTKANAELRQRFAETKALHDQHNLELEARDEEISVLRIENEALKTDLGFDHSEILFLQLQLKALEVEVDALDHGAQRLESYAPEIKDDIQRVKRERIAEEMGKWRQDWQQVDARMSKRRRNHTSIVVGDRDPEDGSEQTDEWQLTTVKEAGRGGRVQSITMRRLTGASFGRKATSAFETNTECNDTGTQTISSFGLPKGGEEENNHAEEDSDCAITTSSEDDEFDVSDDAMRIEPSAAAKSAWQELWEGLAGLAGMGEDRF